MGSNEIKRVRGIKLLKCMHSILTSHVPSSDWSIILRSNCMRQTTYPTGLILQLACDEREFTRDSYSLFKIIYTSLNLFGGGGGEGGLDGRGEWGPIKTSFS